MITLILSQLSRLVMLSVFTFLLDDFVTPEVWLCWIQQTLDWNAHYTSRNDDEIKSLNVFFLAPLLTDERIHTRMRKQHVLPAQSSSLWSKCIWIDRKKNNTFTFKAYRPSGSIVFLPVTYSKFLSGNDHVTLCTD